jgi:hypothetical protein
MHGGPGRGLPLARLIAPVLAHGFLDQSRGLPIRGTIEEIPSRGARLRHRAREEESIQDTGAVGDDESRS